LPEQLPTLRSSPARLAYEGAAIVVAQTRDLSLLPSRAM
jgi:hypothetical protein